ncbi:putative holin-like toxin [Haloimpatiens massiliensis]|nr:putative holin-like toxin [Haloimpatiens massiliensis]
MSNGTLMLLFQVGLFLLALLTFIVLLIDKMSKKIVAPSRIG